MIIHLSRLSILLCLIILFKSHKKADYHYNNRLNNMDFERNFKCLNSVAMRLDGGEGDGIDNIIDQGTTWQVIDRFI